MNTEPKLQEEKDLCRSSFERVVEPHETLVDAKGRAYGPGTVFRYEQDIRAIWTNGILFPGPERVIGTVVEREAVTIDGEEIPMPCKITWEVA